MPALVTDNFARADGALGPNWASVIPNSAEFHGWTGTPQGNVLIHSQGVGPDAVNGLDCCVLWNGGQIFGNNQWASAQIKTIAAPTATLSITAVSGSGSTWTYTYTVLTGSVAAAISGGALYVIVSGMQNAGNNGHFVPTTFGAGTFTVTNASGVTESGSTGSGYCPSDSGAGVMVRASGTSAATITGYFFHVGTNSFGGGGRKAYYELWKVVNGVGTILVGANDTALSDVLPAPGDTLTISAVGTTITAYYNGQILTGADSSYGTGGVFQITDSSISSGGPGLWTFAVSGPQEYVFADWSSGSTQFGGNNGTTLNNFTATDGPPVMPLLSSDALTEGNTTGQIVSDNFQRADGSLGSAWTTPSGSTALQIASHLVEPSAAGSARCVAKWTALTFPNDQYSEITIATLTDSSHIIGPSVRNNGTTENSYIALVLGPTGSSASLIIQKATAGTGSTLATTTITPQVGDVIRISVVGTTITVFQNGTQRLQTTDASYASGQPGIFGFASAGSITGAQMSLWAAGGTVWNAPAKFTIGPFPQAWSSNVTNGVSPSLLDASSFAGFYDHVTVWPNDQYSQVTLTGGTFGTGPMVRQSTSADTNYSWVFGFNSNTLKLIKTVAGVETALFVIAYTFSANDVLRIVVSGSTLFGLLNGIVVAMYTDPSPITSGAAGVAGFNASSSATVKTWSAGGGFTISGGGGGFGPGGGGTGAGPFTFKFGF